LPGRLRQAQFVLPQGTKFTGLKLRAEIEVKGVRYPVQWACRQSGSLELRGSDDRPYHVVDYEDGKDFGVVRGPTAHLSADFSKHLLLEVTPQ
jgi:hypothetical protein